MMAIAPREIRYPFQRPPKPGQGVAVAPGILWLRLPLPMALDHVNVYALDDGAAGWTLIDTGMDTPDARAAWTDALAGPLQGRPVHRVIVSHSHPDHVGLAAWFQARGAALWATRTTWILTRALVLDVETAASEATLAFWRDAGVDADTVARKAAKRPFNFADCVGLPGPFRRIAEGDSITAAGRDWTVRIGNGHAPEQATLWSDDDLVLGADQLLPSISPNLGVYPNEPDADPVAEWLDSCRHLAAFATDRQLVLPGHKLPFTGLPARLDQKIENHLGALSRLHAHLATPQVATDCFVPLFKREIGPGVWGMALAETVAHLNHLLIRGQAARTRRDDGAWLWRAI